MREKDHKVHRGMAVDDDRYFGTNMYSILNKMWLRFGRTDLLNIEYDSKNTLKHFLILVGGKTFDGGPF